MWVLIFGINDVKYGIFLEDVDFISKKINVVKVPGAKQEISGVVMLRDKVMPVYSLASRFGFGEQEYEFLVVVKVDNIQIALEVGMIDRIMWIEKEDVTLLPAIIRATQSCFQEVFAYGKKLIGVLDISGLITKQDKKELCMFIEKNIKKTLDFYPNTD